VARNRIIDRFRKKKEEPLPEAHDIEDVEGGEDSWRLDLVLPASDGGPEAAYARAALIEACRQPWTNCRQRSARSSSPTNSMASASRKWPLPVVPA
jgi:hypothetical protein